MIKIVIGGQLEQEKLKTIVESSSGNKIEVFVKSDLEAAMAVKNGEAQYYFGACNTGGGGALAMAIAMLTIDKCISVSTPSGKIDNSKIINALEEGKVAFGMLPEDADDLIPFIIDWIIKNG